MTIRTITFDWGDTLAANHGMPYRQCELRAFNGLATDLSGLGCTVPEGWAARAVEELEAAWTASISLERNPEHQEIDLPGMIDQWIAATGAMEADAHRLTRAINRCTATLTDTVVAFAETAHALSLLKARGYRLGVLSHVPWPGPACRAWFERNGLAGFFDFYSLSCEVGWIKPNPRHFRHALDQAGCEAAEVLHVGDHPFRDIAGARACGMRTCLRWTERIHAPEELAGCGADACILRLTEVVAVAASL